MTPSFYLPGDPDLPPGVTSHDIERAMGGICPECEGSNLSDDGTTCFDCQAADYE
jgi:hypothetical protein